MDGNKIREIATRIVETAVGHRGATLWLVRRDGKLYWLQKDALAWQWYWCRDDVPLPQHDAALVCTVSLAADRVVTGGRIETIAETVAGWPHVYQEIEKCARRWGEVRIVLLAVRCNVTQLEYMGVLRSVPGGPCHAYTTGKTGERAVALIAYAEQLSGGKFRGLWPVALDTSQLEALLARILGIAVLAVTPAPEEGPEVEVPDVPVEVPEVRLPELEVEL